MKLVFCGNIMDYEQFISKLVSKGKDVRDYRYIRDREYVLGMNSDNILVQLRSYINHPNHPAISAELEHRGIKSASARTNSGSTLSFRNGSTAMFQSGGIIEPRYGISPLPSLISPGSTMSHDQLDSLRYAMEEQAGVPSSQLRGLHTNSVYIDETAAVDPSWWQRIVTNVTSDD